RYRAKHTKETENILAGALHQLFVAGAIIEATRAHHDAILHCHGDIAITAKPAARTKFMADEIHRMPAGSLEQIVVDIGAGTVHQFGNRAAIVGTRSTDLDAAVDRGGAGGGLRCVKRFHAVFPYGWTEHLSDLKSPAGAIRVNSCVRR